MTHPPSSASESGRASAPDRWRTRWLVPAVTAGLGAVILVAEATDGDLTSGLGRRRAVRDRPARAPASLLSV
jgi:hypothetical protein